MNERPGLPKEEHQAVPSSSPELEAINPVRRIMEVVTGFYDKIKKLGEPEVLIKRGLEAQGLGDLDYIKDEYSQLILRLKMVEDASEELYKAKEKGELSNKSILEWIFRWTHTLQMLMEALPRDIGLDANIIKQADEASNNFHQQVSIMLKSMGIEYFPVKTYRDNLDSPSVKTIILHIHSFYQYKYSEELSKAVANVKHGTILRVARLGCRVPPSSDIFKQMNMVSEWQGVYEFAVVENIK